MFRWSPLVAPAGAALLGGVIGGLLVSLIKPPASKGKPLALEKEPASESAPLESRVSLLEQEVKSLRSRPLRIVQPPAPAGSGGRASAPEQPQPAEAAPVVDDPVFEAAVRDILDRVDEERDSERELRSEERRREAATNWTTSFATRAGLNDDQKAKVLKVAQDFLKQLRDQRNPDAGAAASREERRARFRELREQAEKSLAEVLTRDQLAVYEKLEEGDRLGAIFRQGGRRGRDGN